MFNRYGVKTRFGIYTKTINIWKKKKNWLTNVLPDYDHSQLVKYINALAKSNKTNTDLIPKRSTSYYAQKSPNLLDMRYKKGANDFQNTNNNNDRPQIANPGMGKVIQKWIKKHKSNLKPQWKGKINQVCILDNTKNNQCKFEDRNDCLFYNKVWLHRCMCGSGDHRAYNCKIFG